MWQRVQNLEEALARAEIAKAFNKTILFRGQARNWPMLSSFVRKSQDERKAAIEHFNVFHNWIQSIPILEEIASNEDMLLAVAQHYGFATNLVDFTTEPKVAAFFSAHAPPLLKEGEEDLSCIILFDFTELKKICDGIKIVKPDLPLPRVISVDIPELLRIQSQCGVFLEYPYDTSFEQHYFDFDRLIFPTERDPQVLEKLIPLEDIYPSQKSDLEILLDQFFMLDIVGRGNKWFKQLEKEDVIRIRYLNDLPNGIDAECFKTADLPIHESWTGTNLVEWLEPAEETWSPISEAPTINVFYPVNGDSAEKIKVLQAQIDVILANDSQLRTTPVRWGLSGFSQDTTRICRAMELTWDGLRRWPYNSNEISQALATVIEYGSLVAQYPQARSYLGLARELAENCIGKVIDVEIGMQDGSYTRGYANMKSLMETVREDFFSFLSDEWRTQITEITHILQISINPTRTMVFDRLKSVFCTQVVPTQVVLRDEASGKARLYNPARATRLGLA